MTHKASSLERTCIVTRTLQPAKAMLRFVLGPGDVVVPDLKAKLPGRGVYVSTSAASIRQAMKKNAFAKTFKSKVVVSPDLDVEIDALLERAALQALSLANKAGCVIAGSAKVESAIAAKSVIALLHAMDGGGDGARKLAQVVHRNQDSGKDNAGKGHEAAKIADFRLFSSSQLDFALGKTNVVHVALLTGAAGAFFVQSAGRLIAYRHGADQPLQEIFCNEDEICDKSDEISEE